MDKSAIDTPSREIDLRVTFPSTCALPSGGRWRFGACSSAQVRQRKRSSAKSSCGPSRTSSSAPSSPPCCNARCAPPRLATRRRPRATTCPGGCGPTAWRPSTFAPSGARRCRHDTVLPRETTPVGRSGGRDSTPPWWCWASTTGARSKLASDASRAVAMLSSGRSAGFASSAPTASPWQDPPLDRLSAERGPEPAERGVRPAGPRTGKRVVVSLDGGRVRVRRSVAPRRRRGATDSIPTGRNRRLLIRTSSATTATVSDVGPDHRSARSGDRRRSSCCVVRAADRPQRR